MSWCVTVNAGLVATSHSISMTKRQARDLALAKGPGWIPIRTAHIYLNPVTDRVEVDPAYHSMYARSIERFGR